MFSQPRSLMAGLEREYLDIISVVNNSFAAALNQLAAIADAGTRPGEQPIDNLVKEIADDINTLRLEFMSNVNTKEQNLARIAAFKAHIDGFIAKNLLEADPVHSEVKNNKDFLRTILLSIYDPEMLKKTDTLHDKIWIHTLINTKNIDALAKENENTIAKYATVFTPEIFDLAIKKNKTKLAKYLLKHNAPVANLDAITESAALEKDWEMVKLLVKRGANVNYAQSEKNSNYLIHYAVRDGNSEMVRFLLENGANADLLNANGKRTLQIASDNNNIEIFKLLLAHGANPEFIAVTNKGLANSFKLARVMYDAEKATGIVHSTIGVNRLINKSTDDFSAINMTSEKFSDALKSAKAADPELFEKRLNLLLKSMLYDMTPSKNLEEWQAHVFPLTKAKLDLFDNYALTMKGENLELYNRCMEKSGIYGDVAVMSPKSRL